MNLTEEIYNRLTKYRKNLYSACYLDYVRLSSLQDKEELASIFKTIFNKDSGILSGCSRCILRDTKAMGELYFKDEKIKKEEEKKNKEKENTIEENGKEDNNKGRKVKRTKPKAD